MNHVKLCRHCPSEIREELDTLQRTSPSKKEKPKHGGRKVFFHRLWCKVQGIADGMNDDIETPVEKRTGKAAANELLKELGKFYQESHQDRDILPAEVRFSGKIPLACIDDEYVLPEKMYIIRKKCISLFSAESEDTSEGKNVVENQVGIQCNFCKLKHFPENASDLKAIVKR